MDVLEMKSSFSSAVVDTQRSFRHCVAEKDVAASSKFPCLADGSIYYR